MTSKPFSVRPNLLVIRCADIGLSARFYQVLGMEFEKHRHGNGPEHHAAGDGDFTFELYPASTRYPVTIGTRIGFAVDSVDECCARLREAGYVLDSEPADSPWGKRAVAIDPDGHKVELTQNGLV